jgi:hypothetical protein
MAAIGLGEGPARSDLQDGGGGDPPWLAALPPGTLPAEWKHTALVAANQASPIPDDTDNPEWRRVIIVLNGLITVSLDSPLAVSP